MQGSAAESLQPGLKAQKRDKSTPKGGGEALRGERVPALGAAQEPRLIPATSSAFFDLEAASRSRSLFCGDEKQREREARCRIGVSVGVESSGLPTPRPPTSCLSRGPDPFRSDMLGTLQA